jgi:hypothetical protein
MENKSYVCQGTYKIIDKSLGPLITGGLATCSAISFTINDNDIFMTHIDAKTDVIKIAKDIKQLYPDLLQITNVKICYGGGMGANDSTITQKLIHTLTQHLDINITPFKENIQDIILHNQIIQCRICHSKSGTLKIIQHCYNCKYNNPVQITYVGFMDTVNSN